MNGRSASPPVSGETFTSVASSGGPEDISRLLPLSLCKSQLIPPAPNRRRSAIDFLNDFGGSSWISYGASSLLVISQFPSPLPVHENLVSPFFRQVIEPSSVGADDKNAAINSVSWCPVLPSEGEIAAAQGNTIWLYSPHPDSENGSFCWKQTACILQSSIVEAIEWTGSGDGLITAGIDVVFWKREGRSWLMSWKSPTDVPQVMVSATWSIEGPVATAACCLFTSSEMGAQNLPNLANDDCRHVSVYHNDDKSEIMKIQLCHPLPISLIRWRPSTSIKLTEGTLHAWRDVLLTCCLDGTVRLWSEIDIGRSRKLSKGIDNKTRKHFHVVAIIEIEQCLNGTLGRDIFIDWAVDMGHQNLKCEGNEYSPSASSMHDHVASCEWLISVGPLNSVTLWAIHCLDDTATFLSPRVTLWKKQNPVEFQESNLTYQSFHPEEKPVLVKVVAMRSQLCGPPVACSLLQLLPGNSMNWWHFHSPSMDDAEKNPLTHVSKDICLSHFAAGALNLDGHSASILQIALHPCIYELDLAVTLDSNGFLFFWSLAKNFNCTVGLQMYIHPTWKLLGKIRSQDLSADLKYLTIGWAPLVLDEKPLLLLGYAGGIDCFLIKVPGEGKAISSYKIFSLSFASHSHLDGSADHIFATHFPSFSRSFLLYGIWMKEFKALSWKVILQSEEITENSHDFSSDSDFFLRPAHISNCVSCNYRSYSAAICPASWKFPDSHNSRTILCVSVVSLKYSIISIGKHVVSDNDSCGDSYSLLATGGCDGVLQLWKVLQLSDSESIPWFLVGEFTAHNGPVNAVSLSSCGKVATVSEGGKSSMTTLHIWMPICLIGGGSFVLEDDLLLNGPVVTLKWLTMGNGKLLLGVCMPNEFHIYCQRSPNAFMESNKSIEMHAWCCISISHSDDRCHDFLWGPKLTPVLLHETKISIFSEWLTEAEYEHIGHCSSIDIVTDKKMFFDISFQNNVYVANESKQSDNKDSGTVLNLKSNFNTRNRLHNLMDIVERLCESLESYHPWALLQYLYRGNWKRAYIVLKHLVDSLKASDASTNVRGSCNSGKPFHIPQLPLSKYLDGTIPEEPVSGTSQCSQVSNFVSATFENFFFQFGKDTSKPTENKDLSWTAYPKDEILGFIDALEKAHKLTSMEKIQILTIVDILLELSITGYNSLYQSLDEPARRFWVAARFQHFYFLRKVGRVVDAEDYSIESWMVAWAFQSDFQENLLNSLLSTEPSWLEMRNLGFGFWFTNVVQLRAWMEKLARLQYLKRKNPKDCSLLYLALNRAQVLAGLFKVSNDEKDKVLFGFLSRNFQEEKNKAAALKNAYILMGKHELELAVAFFLLGGEPFSAVTVCAKNLGDEQLALVICRLLEGYGGPLEHQLITNILLPNAIEKKDYWLSSLLEWSLGNYSESVKMLFELSGRYANQSGTRKCRRISFADPHIGRYCVILASKHCLRKSIGDYVATVLSKFAKMMDSYSFEIYGLPMEALECFASYTMKPNAEGNCGDIKAHTIFDGLLNPFSTATSTQTWLHAGVAYHLESNLKLSLAMQYISGLMRELSCWTYPEIVKHNCYESDQGESQIGELSKKLNLVIIAFERRYSLKSIDLASMVLLFACNNGLLFLGYRLIQGIIFCQYEVDFQHNSCHSTVCPVVLGLLVKTSKELFNAYSRYVVCCHFSDSTFEQLSGRASIAENYNDSYFQRKFCLRSLIYSLKIIKLSLKYYDNLLITEGLTFTYSLELMEYMMYFSYNWFSRDLRGLIHMVCQNHRASISNFDSIEIKEGELIKILYYTSDSNPSDALNNDAEVLQDFISYKSKVSQSESLALPIPDDEKWILIQNSLWIHNNIFINQLLSRFSATENFAAEKTIIDYNKFPVLIAKVTLTYIAYVSSSLTRQLASFLRTKASLGLPVATFDWLELTNQQEFSYLPHHKDPGLCIGQLSSSESQEAFIERLWVISVNAKEIYKNFLNEGVYDFVYNSNKLHSSWKYFLKVNLSKLENASHNKSEGTFSIVAERNLDANTFLETRSDSIPKLDMVTFANPSEILNRSGEHLEAICCNSINELQLAVASNRKGLLFFNWIRDPSYKKQTLLIWPEADWPSNGCPRLNNTPISTRISAGVGHGSKSGTHLVLDQATLGLGSLARPNKDLTGGGTFNIPGYAGIGACNLGMSGQMEFEDFLDPPATAEIVSSRTLCSHPSRPFLLVGSINTRIYLWEFGKDRTTLTYAVFPAVSVPPPYVLPSISSLKFDYCGYRFASTTMDGIVCTWQLEVEGRSNVLPTESSNCFSTHASDVAYMGKSGSILAAAGCSTNGYNIVLWDTLAPAASQASLFCHEGGASSLSVFDSDVGSGSVSSPIIVSGGRSGDVGLHDLRYIATGKRKSKRSPQELPGDRDLKKSSSTFLDSTFQNADSAENGMIWYIPKAHSGSVAKIAVIPNTNMFLTGGSKDGDVKLWDAKRQQLLFHWPRIHDRPTYTSRSIGDGIVRRAAVTDIKVISCGFLTCGGDGSVKLVQLKR